MVDFLAHNLLIAYGKNFQQHTPESLQMKIATTLAKILAVSALLAFGSMANAAVMQHTYNFTATGFAPGAPVDPVVGSITATFDQSAVGSGSVDAITLNIGTHVFTAGEAGFTAWGGNGILFGGVISGLNGMSGNTNDFWLYWLDFNTFSYGNLSYANQPKDPDDFFFFSNSLTVNEGSVPEPATLALLGLGLFGFAASRRRKQ